ncbi:ribosome maturation factor RimP [Desulfotomaculum sp. 1211_IL3151]|uniref:ribosome maturation factor RimP n=1 Tax=Desulfotomaculum sp. 1211_IL3151 TaxID=3084055 RepID=UPI002FDAB79A
MAKSTVVERVTEAVQPIIEGLNLELVDVEYVKEGGNWYLRIFIDKPEGVELDDCQIASEKIDTLLDELDPIPQAYFLEVSSPGIERPLKKPQDFVRFKGQLVNVTTFAPVNGVKSFTGKLMEYNEEGIHLDIKGKQVVLPHQQVAAARLAIEI